MAQRLHHVLLPVFETVGIPVLVAIGLFGVGVVARAVHAHADVVHGVVRGRSAVVGNRRRAQIVKVVGIELSFGQHACGRRVAVEENTRILVFPRVGEAVHIGIDRARVEAAAAHAAGDGGIWLAVDRVVRHAHRRTGYGAELLLAPAVDDERGLPGFAFGAVVYAVAVGIAVSRIGREELVVPTLDDTAVLSGIVGVDRLAVLVGKASVGSGEFACKGEAVGGVFVAYLVVEPLVISVGEFDVGVHADVQLPAVRHAILVGIGAVHRFAVGLRAVCRGVSGGVGVGGTRPDYVGELLDRILVVGYVVGVLIVVGKAVQIAVLDEPELVERGELDRVLRHASAASVALLEPAPYGRERIIVVPVPACTRVEAVVAVDLIVVERHRPELARDERTLGDGEHKPVGQTLRRFRKGSLLGHPAAGEPDDLEAENRNRVRAGAGIVLKGGDNLVHGIAAAADGNDLVGSEFILGHEVAVAVERPVVALAVVLQRIDSVHHLVEVAETVAVGIPLNGICADENLFRIENAVAVGILLRPVAVYIGVEYAGNVGGGDVRRAFDILQVELLACDRRTRLVEADGGRVPEVVFVAVGHSVAVGVVRRRIGAVFDGEAPGRGVFALAAEVAPCPGDVGLGVRHDVVIGHEVGELVGVPVVALLDVAVQGGDFGLAHVEVGDPPLALLLMEAEHAVVEAVVEAAHLDRGRKRLAARPVASRAGHDRRLLYLVRGRQEVVVAVVVSEVGQVGAGAVHADERDGAVAPCSYRREQIGHAVLVDIAHVVAGLVFLREDAFDGSLGIVYAVARLLVGQRNLAAGLSLALEFGGGGSAVDRRRGSSVLGGGDEPGVEERILDRIPIVVVGREILGAVGGVGAVRVERDVAREADRSVESAVVNGADLVAEAPDVRLGGEAAVPRKGKAAGACEGRVGIDMALAAALGLGVLLRQTGGGYAARRTAGGRGERLGGFNLEEPGSRRGADAGILVLVGHGYANLLYAGRLEARDERMFQLIRHVRGLFVAVVGRPPLHRKLAREVDIDIAHAPRDGVAVADRSRKAVGGGILLAERADERRRHVLYREVERIGHEIVAPLDAGRSRNLCFGDDLGREYEALLHARLGTVGLVDVEREARLLRAESSVVLVGIDR